MKREIKTGVAIVFTCIYTDTYAELSLTKTYLLLVVDATLLGLNCLLNKKHEHMHFNTSDPKPLNRLYTCMHNFAYSAAEMLSLTQTVTRQVRAAISCVCGCLLECVCYLGLADNAAREVGDEGLSLPRATPSATTSPTLSPELLQH